jgi:selenide,water dikinase
MQLSSSPVVKDLVLIGGGHAHVSVLKKFAMQPLPGLRLTLITRDIHTPYSGMLPGYIAGLYDFDQCHIDLGPLARFAQARLYHGSLEYIDTNIQQVHVTGRPPVAYDLLSINSGSRPGVNKVPGAENYALVAKPIDIFLQRWEALQQKILASQGIFRIIVIGGGAGGVELALASQYKLQNLLRAHGDDPARIEYKLLTSGSEILNTHNAGVRATFTATLKQRNIELLLHHNVSEITEKFVIVEDKQDIPADAVIFVTNASSPAWPEASGLAVDEHGFIRVNQYLQSVSHENIFAGGDVVSLPDPRPKSGVFAVRQGPILAKNLRQSALGHPLKKYHPQKRFLGLITTGNQYAVASWGAFSAQGRWIWKWKDWIDRAFMDKYNVLPDINEDQNISFSSGIAGQEAKKELSTMAMRCGGCGAKVGSSILHRVMQRLPEKHREDVLIGRNSPDDSAMIAVPEGKVLVQSVDYFRAFINDTYSFGAIAANHALGDVFAMGAEAQSVLAIATVPYGREKVVEETLFEVLAGALSVIDPTGAVLIGGHSAEGAELAFGLTVNGLVDQNAVWRKSGLRVGDQLILTKAIGTGTLFAADMRYQAKGRWIEHAIASMLLSNQQAAECLKKYDVSACTDVTGFGLLGHLIEMTKASQVDAEIKIRQVPILKGALETVRAGILSSLQPQNLRLRRAINNIQEISEHEAYPLLFDPQTAGGLLAGVAAKDAQDCIHALHQSGYEDACIIGEVKQMDAHDAPIQLTTT